MKLPHMDVLICSGTVAVHTHSPHLQSHLMFILCHFTISYFHCKDVRYAISAVTGIYNHFTVFVCMHLYNTVHFYNYIYPLLLSATHPPLLSTQPPLPSLPSCCETLAVVPHHMAGESVYRTVNTVIVSFQYLQCMYS